VKRINRCVFPIAGLGTRFLPVTKSVAKEMLPVFSKPLIHYGVEEAVSAELEKITFVINEYKHSIRDYFSRDSYINTKLIGSNKATYLQGLNNLIKGCKFNYINQTNPLGLGHAVLLAKEVSAKEPFGVILPDDLCFNSDMSVISQMVKVYEKYPNHAIVAIEEVEQADVEKYGIVDIEEFNKEDDIFMVTGLVEKPSSSEAPSNLAVIGRYILIPEIFEILQNTSADRNNEIQLTDALNKLSKKQKVLAFKFKGKRFDCGSPLGLLAAANFFSKKTTDTIY